MKILKAVTVCFATFVFILVSISCSKSLHSDYSEIPLPNANGSSVGYNGPLQGSVISEETPTLSRSNNLEESIRSSSLEKLWLVFPSSNGNEESRVEVPANAMTELNSYFRYRLRFCLIPDQLGSSNVDEKVKQDMRLLRESNKVTNQLTNIEIDAPDGRRRISQIEADRLIIFITKSAVDLCSDLRKRT